MTLKRNTFYCRIIALLILIMMARYHAIFVLMTDPSSGVYTWALVAIFYVLNILTMIGLFIPRRWGFILSYFALPISTLLFAVSYLSFLTDWLPLKARLYVTPFANALLLLAVITLQFKRRQLKG